MSAAPDPLSPFRARGAKTEAPPPRAMPRYQAVGTASGTTKPARLDIRPKTAMAVARLYSSISEIAYDRGDYTGILLVLPGKLVKIRGRNLQTVVDALLQGTAEFIAELKDGDSTADGVPVITSIEMLTPQQAAS